MQLQSLTSLAIVLIVLIIIFFAYSFNEIAETVFSFKFDLHTPELACSEACSITRFEFVLKSYTRHFKNNNDLHLYIVYGTFIHNQRDSSKTTIKMCERYIAEDTAGYNGTYLSLMEKSNIRANEYASVKKLSHN